MLPYLHQSRRNMIAHKYKYQLIADCVKQEIKSGVFADGILPRDIELADRLNVSQGTVYSALSILAKEGIIKRVKGKGTFIANPDTTIFHSQQVGLIMTGSGDFFSPMYQEVMQCLQKKKLFPLSISCSIQNDKLLDITVHENIIKKLFGTSLRGIIIDGLAYWIHPFIKDNSYRNVVFIHCYDAPGNIPGNAVLADYEKAIYMATSHLASMGHHKIILFTCHPGWFPVQDESHKQNQPWCQCDSGYLKAMQEHGLAQEQEIIHWVNESEDFLRGVLSRPHRPTALVCVADSQAFHAIMLAISMGLKVPDDLAVTGMYNTPWCTRCPIPITSVSFEEHEIARKAVEMIFNEEPSRQLIYIQPKLIIRKSCGGK